MGTSYSTRYTINGLIRTDQTALDNLEKLANAAGAWMTYDTHAGKFAVVINKAGEAEWHFDDSNIVGGINIAFTPLDRLYNTVKVTYPHEDLKGETDFVQIAIPPGDRLANEYENVLQLQYDIVTNPVQAELLGFIELKQSRVDKVVTFKSDYTKLGIKAGDLFDITNSMYGWDHKMFRVVSVSESDIDDGAIEITITGLEYDPSVYDEDLTRYIRTDSSGITPLASLPAPTKPTVVATETVSRPHVTISTSLIGGIVTAIEVWSSPDVTLADNLRSYSLLKTITTGDTLPLNQLITTEVDSVSASTFVVKCRAVNSDGVSVFSLPSDTAYYQGTQVPDAINDGTLIIDPATGRFLSSAGLALLLKLLSQYLGNGQTSFVDKIGQTVSDPTTIQNALMPMGFMVSATSGQVVNAAIPAGARQLIYQTTFVAPFTGNYSGSVIVDQNVSSAVGGRGTDYNETDDTMKVRLILTELPSNVEIAYESSGGTGSMFWTDWAMSIQGSLVQGHQYKLEFQADNLANDGDGELASMTVNWNIFTVKT